MLILTFESHLLEAQKYEWIDKDFPESRVVGIYEIEGKVYAAVSNANELLISPGTNYHLVLYEFEFNKSGSPGFKLHEITSVYFPENFRTLSIEYIKETQVWIFVQSASVSPYTELYRVALFDNDLNFITSQSIETKGVPGIFQMDTYKGVTLILGSVILPNELFYLSYNHNNPHYLSPIQLKQSEPRETFFPTSMEIDHRTGNMLVFYYSGIEELDSNLHQVVNNYPFDIHTAVHGYAIQQGNYYYSHGTTRQSELSKFKFLVFQKYDTLFNTISADTFGMPGHDNYPFSTKSLDYRDQKFIIGGHLDGFASHPRLFESKKKFYLAKYDDEFQPIWYREYGGDKAYWLHGVHLLKNGGCLAYGFVTDSIDLMRSAYILYVNENGDTITPETIPYYLNLNSPGNELLQINNTQNRIVQIEIYDLNGRQLLKDNIPPGISNFDTMSWTAGIYPYLFFYDGFKIGSGKWVKVK